MFCSIIVFNTVIKFHFAQLPFCYINIFFWPFFTFMQYVHSAFQTLLGHFRSRGLEKFKNDLDRSVKSENKGFAPSVRSRTEAAMLEFDTNIKGKGLSDWVLLLNSEICETCIKIFLFRKKHFCILGFFFCAICFN
jgi:hypothetical protein